MSVKLNVRLERGSEVSPADRYVANQVERELREITVAFPADELAHKIGVSYDTAAEVKRLIREELKARHRRRSR